MLNTIDLRGRSDLDYRTVVPRAALDVNAAMATIAPVVEAVRTEGAPALHRFAEQFDHVTVEHLRVPGEAISRAVAGLDPDLRAAIEVSIDRRRQVCGAEAGDQRRSVELAAGATVITKTIPVNRVGLYVPGGVAPLASSVVMNVVPAQAAGVGSLAVASPPQADVGGLPHPTILAVCGLLGIDEVYAVGGAQAIAMFAYGVEGLCRRADLVTGPGNIYVVAAKRLLRGVIGIDSEAGPTEIAILADATADAGFVAADLVSQAEHDPMAGSVLVTDSIELAEAVPGEIDAVLHQLAAVSMTEQSDYADGIARIRTALAGPQSGIVLVDDLDQGLAVVDAYGAEHLEIHTRDAAAVAERVTNAGAIFVGPHAPVSLGDYCAGSTHVLPTGGTAAHSSGLVVKSFCKSVHLIDYDAAGLADVAADVATFATAERLPGHAYAVRVRSDNA